MEIRTGAGEEERGEPEFKMEGAKTSDILRFITKERSSLKDDPSRLPTFTNGFLDAVDELHKRGVDGRPNVQQGILQTPLLKILDKYQASLRELDPEDSRRGEVERVIARSLKAALDMGLDKRQGIIGDYVRLLVEDGEMKKHEQALQGFRDYQADLKELERRINEIPIEWNEDERQRRNRTGEIMRLTDRRRDYRREHRREVMNALVWDTRLDRLSWEEIDQADLEGADSWSRHGNMELAGDMLKRVIIQDLFSSVNPEWIVSNLFESEIERLAAEISRYKLPDNWREVVYRRLLKINDISDVSDLNQGNEAWATYNQDRVEEFQGLPIRGASHQFGQTPDTVPHSAVQVGLRDDYPFRDPRGTRSENKLKDEEVEALAKEILRNGGRVPPKPLDLGIPEPEPAPTQPPAPEVAPQTAESPNRDQLEQRVRELDSQNRAHLTNRPSVEALQANPELGRQHDLEGVRIGTELNRSYNALDQIEPGAGDRLAEQIRDEENTRQPAQPESAEKTTDDIIRRVDENITNIKQITGNDIDSIFARRGYKTDVVTALKWKGIDPTLYAVSLSSLPQADLVELMGMLRDNLPIQSYSQLYGMIGRTVPGIPAPENP